LPEHPITNNRPHTATTANSTKIKKRSPQKYQNLQKEKTKHHDISRIKQRAPKKYKNTKKNTIPQQ